MGLFGGVGILRSMGFERAGRGREINSISG
jgi:hypothetical protein